MLSTMLSSILAFAPGRRTNKLEDTPAGSHVRAPAGHTDTPHAAYVHVYSSLYAHDLEVLPGPGDGTVHALA